MILYYNKSPLKSASNMVQIFLGCSSSISSITFALFYLPISRSSGINSTLWDLLLNINNKGMVVLHTSLHGVSTLKYLEIIPKILTTCALIPHDL